MLQFLRVLSHPLSRLLFHLLSRLLSHRLSHLLSCPLSHLLSHLLSPSHARPTCPSCLPGAATIVVSLAPRFQVPAYRNFRAAMFAGLGLWGIVPTAHICMSYGHVDALRIAMIYDLCMGAVYLVSGLSDALAVETGGFAVW